MKKSILIVDDDELLSELLAHKLKHEGYATTVAQSGESALNLIESNKPDAIVLDGMMAGIDGIEVLKRLKANENTRNIPVLMLSARGMEADIVQALELGADEYLTKPFMTDELVMRLKIIFKRNAGR